MVAQLKKKQKTKLCFRSTYLFYLNAWNM